jgi:hypothetical protein
MATDFCQKCKQAYPGCACEYDEEGDCPETVDPNENAESSAKASIDRNDGIQKK